MARPDQLADRALKVLTIGGLIYLVSQFTEIGRSIKATISDFLPKSGPDPLQGLPEADFRAQKATERAIASDAFAKETASFVESNKVGLIQNAVIDKYKTSIKTNATRFGFAPELITSIIWHESSGNPRATASAGEVGLMQVIPAALTDVNKTYGYSYSMNDLFTPDIAIRVGTAYLAWVRNQARTRLQKYDTFFIVRAYNAGVTGAFTTSNGTAYADKVTQTEALLRKYKVFA